MIGTSTPVPDGTNHNIPGNQHVSYSPVHHLMLVIHPYCTLQSDSAGIRHRGKGGYWKGWEVEVWKEMQSATVQHSTGLVHSSTPPNPPKSVRVWCDTDVPCRVIISMFEQNSLPAFGKWRVEQLAGLLVYPKRKKRRITDEPNSHPPCAA